MTDELGSTITLHDGRILRTHQPHLCENDETCAVHRPSDHEMRQWPIDWQDGILVRRCKHGYWHPDPDALSFALSRYEHWRAKHACDGCCGQNVHAVQQKIPEGEKTYTVVVVNAVRCGYCKDLIESKYRHDFTSCSCGKSFVDGGHDYFRVGGDNWEDCSEQITVPVKGHKLD